MKTKGPRPGDIRTALSRQWKVWTGEHWDYHAGLAAALMQSADIKANASLVAAIAAAVATNNQAEEKQA